MTPSLASKQWLQRQLQSSGIKVDSAALTELASFIEDIDQPEHFLNAVLDEIEREGDGRKLTLSIVKTVVQSYNGQKGSMLSPVQAIDAFSVPFIEYDMIRKLFHSSASKRKVFADAKSKIDLYVNRFLLVQQRVKRHPLFRPALFDGIMENRGSRDIAELTELKALLGLVGQRRYVLGFLTQKEVGKYYIEDLSARLPLDLSAAETSDGLFTENSIVIAEGELTPGGTFRAVALGLPPAEPREDSLAALQGLDFFGGEPFHSGLSDYGPKRQLWETEFQDDRVIFLSDVELDRPAVIERLHVVFKGFSALDPPPSTFVLMGNFQSYDANTPTTNFSVIRENFALLARVISKYPALCSNRCQFLIIPGPGDLCPGQNILPRPPLPNSIAQPLLEVLPGNVKFCSNPCRIRHGPAELVLFRCNLQRRMRSLCILDTQRQSQTQIQSSLKSTAFDQLCATLLQESHLCPLPLEYQTVAWEWDHSLWLYPRPNALVVADSDLESSRFTFDTTSCLNPGSIAHGTFGAWQPTSNEMELCDVENDMVEGEEADEVENEDEDEDEDAGEGEDGEEGA